MNNRTDLEQLKEIVDRLLGLNLAAGEQETEYTPSIAGVTVPIRQEQANERERLAAENAALGLNDPVSQHDSDFRARVRAVAAEHAVNASESIEDTRSPETIALGERLKNRAAIDTGQADLENVFSKETQGKTGGAIPPARTNRVIGK